MALLPDNVFTMTLSDGRKSALVSVEIKSVSRAKNFRLRVSGKNNLTLTKPAWTSKKSAIEFLNSSAAWALERLEKASEKFTLREWLSKNPSVYVGGARWQVFLTASRTDAFFVEDINRAQVVFSSPEPNAKGADALCLTFKDFVSKKITELVAQTAERMDIRYSSVTVRDQSGRWGSRSTSGKLSFNWRLILLPSELQNYIICHELAHVRFMDHSVSFWLWLNSFCPSAKRLDRQVSKYAPTLFNIELK